MSWYSDNEPFDEYDPEYCERIKCNESKGKEYCDNCMKALWLQESEDEDD